MCPDFNRINRVLSVQPGSIQDWHCDGCEDRCDRVKDPKERKCQSVEGTIKNEYVVYSFTFMVVCRVWVSRRSAENRNDTHHLRSPNSFAYSSLAFGSQTSEVPTVDFAHFRHEFPENSRVLCLG